MKPAESYAARCAIYSDVTAQVLSETQLQLRTQELETVLDVAPVALAITRDRQCSEVQMNGAFKRMNGLPLTQVPATGRRRTR